MHGVHTIPHQDVAVCDTDAGTILWQDKVPILMAGKACRFLWAVSLMLLKGLRPGKSEKEYGEPGLRGTYGKWEGEGHVTPVHGPGHRSVVGLGSSG